jgi:MSHA biogenesis protein MshE
MSAIATVHRLRDVGAEGYMIAAAVHGIVAQRLVRKVCENCAQPTPPDAHEIAWLEARSPGGVPVGSFMRGAGCAYCNHSGYRGRIAVHELLEMDWGLADAIRRGELREFDLEAQRRPAYVSLATRALELAGTGVTSVAEAIGVDSSLDDPLNPVQPSLLEDALAADATSARA